MSERGSIMPLIGGALALALAMVFGVASATSLLIERGRLYSLADAAATVAAESFAPRDVRRGPSGVVVPLNSAAIRASVGEYLARAGSAPLQGVVIEAAATPDGRIAEVTLSSLWGAPLFSELFPPSLRISVTARAQVLIV